MHLFEHKRSPISMGLTGMDWDSPQFGTAQPTVVCDRFRMTQVPFLYFRLMNHVVFLRFVHSAPMVPISIAALVFVSSKVSIKLVTQRGQPLSQQTWKCADLFWKANSEKFQWTRSLCTSMLNGGCITSATKKGVAFLLLLPGKMWFRWSLWFEGGFRPRGAWVELLPWPRRRPRKEVSSERSSLGSMLQDGILGSPQVPDLGIPMECVAHAQNWAVQAQQRSPPRCFRANNLEANV